MEFIDTAPKSKKNKKRERVGTLIYMKTENTIRWVDIPIVKSTSIVSSRPG